MASSGLALPGRNDFLTKKDRIMKNNILLKTLLGVATGLYLLMPVLAIGVWFLTFPMTAFFSIRNNSEPPILFFVGFALFMATMLFTNLLHFIIVPTYIVLLLRNNSAQEIIRIILGIGLFFIPFLAAPIYFLIYILPTNPPGWALQPVAITSPDQASGKESSD